MKMSHYIGCLYGQEILTPDELNDLYSAKPELNAGLQFSHPQLRRITQTVQWGAKQSPVLSRVLQKMTPLLGEKGPESVVLDAEEFAAVVQICCQLSARGITDQDFIVALQILQSAGNPEQKTLYDMQTVFKTLLHKKISALMKEDLVYPLKDFCGVGEQIDYMVNSIQPSLGLCSHRIYQMLRDRDPIAKIEEEVMKLWNSEYQIYTDYLQYSILYGIWPDHKVDEQELDQYFQQKDWFKIRAAECTILGYLMETLRPEDDETTAKLMMIGKKARPAIFQANSAAEVFAAAESAKSEILSYYNQRLVNKWMELDNMMRMQQAN